MGRRALETTHYTTPATARKVISKCNKIKVRNIAGKAALATATTGHSRWHDNDDEDSSSSNEAAVPKIRKTELLNDSKFINSSSSFLNLSNVTNNSLNTTDSPRPAYKLHPNVVNGTKLKDLTNKRWLLGKPIGKGNFGEIFLASDNTNVPATHDNAKFVVKMEPHSNGPLFVEIHCLMNTARHKRKEGEEEGEEEAIANIPVEPTGIPDYIAAGSHTFAQSKYRFLVLPRFDQDLHSLIRNRRVHQRYVLTLAVHIVDVLKNLHDKGYCHNDVKAQNLMISKCRYYKPKCGGGKATTAQSHSQSSNSKVNIKSINYDKHYEEKVQTTDSGNSSEQDLNYDDDEFDSQDSVLNRANFQRSKQLANQSDSEEYYDEDATSHSAHSSSIGAYETPIKSYGKRARKSVVVQYSGSNPVRSCRRQKPANPMYDEMVSSHYLRPSKRINYTEFFNEDCNSNSNFPKEDEDVSMASDAVSEFFPDTTSRRSTVKKATKQTPTTRHKQKLQQKRTATLSDNRTTTVGTAANNAQCPRKYCIVEEERMFLIDFGLASKYIDRGVHRPFVMDQRRAHDGTLEFTSRDAHMGAHSRRSDLECLGYNLIFWSQGYLPWKEAATQQQQEKVHRAKEYVMTDVREMLKQIYGKQVPKYLGEFLHQVGKLAYHERPDYEHYRRIFEREFQQLGFSPKDMQINSKEITRTCVLLKEEIENKYDIFDVNNLNGLAHSKNSSVGTPFQENTIANRVSPKNLRSMSDKKSLKKKKFCWAEILAQDPDQIARERAQKEFDREDIEDNHVPRRYEGKPTYAILAAMSLKCGSQDDDEEEELDIEVQNELAARYGIRRKHLNRHYDVQIKKEEAVIDKEEEEIEEYDDIDNEEDDNDDDDNCEDDDELENEEKEEEEQDDDENELTDDSEYTTGTEDNEDIDMESDESSSTKPKTRRTAKQQQQLTKTNACKATTKRSSGTMQTTNRKRRQNTTQTHSISSSNNNKITITLNKCSNGKTNSINNSGKKQRRTASAAARYATTAIKSAPATAAVIVNGSNSHCQHQHQLRPERRTRRCLIKTDLHRPNELVRIVEKTCSDSAVESPHLQSLACVWNAKKRNKHF